MDTVVVIYILNNGTAAEDTHTSKEDMGTAEKVGGVGRRWGRH